MALPYTPQQRDDCAPWPAAAYDFAFCHLHYALAALSAPAPGMPRAATFKEKSAVYAKVSVALSDADTFKRNTELAKKFYESLNGQDSASTASALNYVRGKCENIEMHHAETLREMISKRKP